MRKSALFKERIKSRGGEEPSMPRTFLCGGGGVQSDLAPGCRLRLLLGKRPRSCSQGILLLRETSRWRAGTRSGGKTWARQSALIIFLPGGVCVGGVCCSLRLFSRSWRSPPAVERGLKGVKAPFAALAASASGSNRALSPAKPLFPPPTSSLPTGTEPGGHRPLCPEPGLGAGAGGLSVPVTGGIPGAAPPALGRRTRAKFGRNEALARVGRVPGQDDVPGDDDVPASLPGGKAMAMAGGEGGVVLFSSRKNRSDSELQKPGANGDT